MLNDGILYCYNNGEVKDAHIVVPAHERTKILATYHDDATAGHYGSKRTIARIGSRYFRPGLRSDITSYERKCIECQRYKASNTESVFYRLRAANIVSKFWQLIYLVHWYKLTRMDFNGYLLPKM